MRMKLSTGIFILLFVASLFLILGRPIFEQAQRRWFMKDPVEVLIQRLLDPRETTAVRSAAAQALGEITDPRGIPPLITVFRSQVPFEKKISDALRNFGATAGDDLITLFQERGAYAATVANNQRKYPSFVLLIPVLLGEIEDTSAAPLLRRTLADRSEAPELRAECALGLGLLKDKESIPELIAAVSDPHPPVRAGAARALGQIVASKKAAQSRQNHERD